MKIVKYILLFCAFVPAFSFAQSTLKSDLSLKYLISLSTVKKSPLIILLHGYGSNETDLFTLKNAFPKKYTIVSARAPITTGPDAYEWFHNQTINNQVQGDVKDLKKSRNSIKIFIGELVKKYQLDPAQVYLLGFSQGAMMTYEVGLTAPELVKGIVPLSGKIFDSLKPDISKPAPLKNLKVFIGHGDADNRVPVKLAIQAASDLKRLGALPVLHLYKGVEHSISDQEIADVVKWMM